MRAEQLTDPVAYHGEGQVWSPRWGGPRWVDMLAGDVLALSASGVTRRHVGRIAAALRPGMAGTGDPHVPPRPVPRAGARAVSGNGGPGE